MLASKVGEVACGVHFSCLLLRRLPSCTFSHLSYLLSPLSPLFVHPSSLSLYVLPLVACLVSRLSSLISVIPYHFAPLSSSFFLRRPIFSFHFFFACPFCTLSFMLFPFSSTYSMFPFLVPASLLLYVLPLLPCLVSSLYCLVSLPPPLIPRLCSFFYLRPSMF